MGDSAASVVSAIAEEIDREHLGAYGVHVLIGEDEAQHRWRSDDRVNIYSASKGVCALAVGIAVDAGILSLESRVGHFLSGMQLGAGVESVTVRHLLTMTSGIDFVWFGSDEAPWPDLAQEMLRRPSVGQGRAFQYSDASTYVLMRMLGAAVGDVRDWLMPRLFEPLGIHNPQWHRCPLGWVVAGSGLELRTEELARIGRVLRDRGLWHPLGWVVAGSGLELRTEELARIGRVLRDRGLWHEHRIVDAEWIDGMHGDWVATGSSGDSDRYGFAVWAGPRDGWRLDGRYGQYVYVDQARNAVVTITAHEETRDHRLVEISAAALAH